MGLYMDEMPNAFKLIKTLLVEKLCARLGGEDKLVAAIKEVTPKTVEAIKEAGYL